MRVHVGVNPDGTSKTVDLGPGQGLCERVSPAGRLASPFPDRGDSDRRKAQKAEWLKSARARAREAGA